MYSKVKTIHSSRSAVSRTPKSEKSVTALLPRVKFEMGMDNGCV